MGLRLASFLKNMGISEMCPEDSCPQNTLFVDRLVAVMVTRHSSLPTFSMNLKECYFFCLFVLFFFLGQANLFPLIFKNNGTTYDICLTGQYNELQEINCLLVRISRMAQIQFYI